MGLADWLTHAGSDLKATAPFRGSAIASPRLLRAALAWASPEVLREAVQAIHEQPTGERAQAIELALLNLASLLDRLVGPLQPAGAPAASATTPAEGGHGDLLESRALVWAGLAAIREAQARQAEAAFAHYEAGIAFGVLDRPEASLEHLRRVVTMDAESVAAWAALGEILRGQQRLGDALSALDRAAALAPKHAWTLATRGQVLVALGRLSEAVESLEAALRLDPTLVWAYADLTRALLEQGAPDQAVAALDRALVLAPESAVLLAARGEALQSLGRSEEAAEQLEQALSRDSSLVGARVSLARCSVDLGRFEPALLQVERALAASPNDPALLTIKANALRGLERYGEALAVLDVALRQAPDDARALLAKGKVLLAQRQPAAAASVLERAVALDPRLSSIRVELAATWYEIGRAEEALAAVNLALQHAPDDAAAWELKGRISRKLRPLAETIAAYERALQNDPGRVTAWAALGDALRIRGDNEAALEALDRALQSQPDDVQSLRSKGYALLSLRRLDEARQAFEQVLARRAGDPLALTDIAAVLQSQHRHAEALAAVDRALEARPDLLWPLTIKGSLLCDIAAYATAVEVLDRAIRSNPPASGARLLKAWALEHQPTAAREQLLREAAAIYREAMADEANRLWCQKGIGNVLYELNDQAAAAESYQAVLDDLDGRGEVAETDVDLLSLRGWCLGRLGDLDSAAAVMLTALTLDYELIAVRFDLALVTLLAGRHDLALREYASAIEQAEATNPLRCRGLVDVARHDLRVTRAIRPELRGVTAVRDALRLLEQAFERADDAATAPAPVSSIETPMAPG